MKYEVYLTRRAEKDILKLDEQTRSFIRIKILEYAVNPFAYAKKLSNTILGSYRFRIGDYRVIADIEDNNIIILRIGHRKEVYK